MTDNPLLARLREIPFNRAWGDETCKWVDSAFETVSRNPSDHESALAYRRAITALLDQIERKDKALRPFADALLDDGSDFLLDGLDVADFIKARNALDGRE